MRIRVAIRQWMQLTEPILHAWGFHQMKALTQNGIGKMFNRSVKPQTLDDVKIPLPVGFFGITLFVLLFTRYFIKAPNLENGALDLNMGLWVSFLSFEATATLAYIAVLPWLVKVNISGFTGFLSGAYRNKWFPSVSDDLTTMSGDEFETEMQKVISEQEDKVATQLMARSMVRGGALLILIIALMPIGFWLSVQWKLGALATLMVCLLFLVFDIFQVGVFSHLDSMWDMFHVMVVAHEKLGDQCPICKGASSLPVQRDRRSILTHWRGIVLSQALWIWPLDWFTSRGSGVNGVLVWTRWTWWLFFTPVYIVVLSWISRKLKAWVGPKFQAHSQ